MSPTSTLTAQGIVAPNKGSTTVVSVRRIQWDLITHGTNSVRLVLVNVVREVDTSERIYNIGQSHDMAWIDFDLPPSMARGPPAQSMSLAHPGGIKPSTSIEIAKHPDGVKTLGRNGYTSTFMDIDSLELITDAAVV